jgi:GWxTD domain-containing protein
VKNILLISLLLFPSLFAQPSRREELPVVQSLFHSETIIIPGENNNLNLSYTYKIPYNRLVFEREGGEYSAGLRVLVEVSDSTSDLIDRDIKDTELSVNDFEATNERGFFLQDFLKFNLSAGKYTIRTTITDLNSQNELKLEPAEIDLIKADEEMVLHPLVIESVNDECEIENAFILANFGGAVPFSPKDYHLVIPLRDTTLENISVTIVNNKDTLVNQEISEFYTLPVGISTCNTKLVLLQDDESISTQNFIVRNVNRKLIEGKVSLIVRFGDDGSKEFNSEVIWIDKPFSLRDPTMAIEYLNFIAPDSIIYRMLSFDKSEYPKVLHEYWTSFDPTPESSFNQLMTEYYRRIDYAAKEFRGLGKDNGIKTDRGMIYIRFGKPDEVERSSNTQGQVVETWIYKNPERKFVFVDKRGIGNFTLIES